MPVPGPCAAIAALCAAGLPTDHFVFEGFLPRREGARAERLDWLRDEQRTIVFYEAVHRVAETLAALRRDVRRRTPRGARARAHEDARADRDGHARPSSPRASTPSIPLLGEFVIVVAGAAAASPDEAEARRVYELLAAELAPDKALKLTAAITGVSRNALYRLMRT